MFNILISGTSSDNDRQSQQTRLVEILALRPQPPLDFRILDYYRRVVFYPVYRALGLEWKLVGPKISSEHLSSALLQRILDKLNQVCTTPDPDAM